MCTQRQFLIRVNLELLREHLSREDRAPWSIDEVRQWLVNAGFEPAQDDQWRVSEADLGQLDPAEAISVEPIDAN